MIELDRIALADCFTPKELVTEIFKQLPYISFPVPLHEIAKACGIIKFQNIAEIAVGELSESFPEGFLTSQDKYIGVIHYKENAKAPYRKRFTIAHELGHFLLLHHKNYYSQDELLAEKLDYENAIDEDEANLFARTLLLPEHILLDELNSQKLSLHFFKELAELSQTSFSFLCDRVRELLSDRAIVLMSSKDGYCNYVRANWEFLPSNIVCSRNDQVPDFCNFLKKLSSKDEYITDKRKVDPNSWFQSLPDDFAGTVYEQTYYQQDGYAITLLLIE